MDEVRPSQKVLLGEWWEWATSSILCCLFFLRVASLFDRGCEDGEGGEEEEGIFGWVLCIKRAKMLGRRRNT